MELKRRWWLLGLIVLLFGTSFTWAYLTFGLPRKAPEPSSNESLISKLSGNAEIIRTFVLPDGTYGASLVEPVAYNWIGLTAAEFTRLNPEWKVISFSSERVVVEEPCNLLENEGFIRLEHGVLKIYTGEIDGCHKLHSTEDVDVQHMPLIQRLELESGILYKGEELSSILDGISTP